LLRSGRSFLVQSVDVSLETLTVYPPYPTTSDLHGGQVAGAHEGVNLSDADRQVDRNILELQETWLDPVPFRRRGIFHVEASLAARCGFFRNLAVFGPPLTLVGVP
jgi:hypothetical protein